MASRIVLIEQKAKQALLISDGLVLEQGQTRVEKDSVAKSLPIRGSRKLFLGGGLAPVGGVS